MHDNSSFGQLSAARLSLTDWEEANVDWRSFITLARRDPCIQVIIDPSVWLLDKPPLMSQSS